MGQHEKRMSEFFWNFKKPDLQGVNSVVAHTHHTDIGLLPIPSKCHPMGSGSYGNSSFKLAPMPSQTPRKWKSGRHDEKATIPGKWKQAGEEEEESLERVRVEKLGSLMERREALYVLLN